MRKISPTAWMICLISIVIVILAIACIPTIIIDPFFHYHYPNSKYDYVINNQRYQNDGVTRFWDYDAIITGTSMSENFDENEVKDLFGGNPIKICFSGGYYREVDQNLRRAYNSGKNIKYVIRSIDGRYFSNNADEKNEKVDYPTYLTNDNPFDDVNYLLNKTVLLGNDVTIYESRKSKVDKSTESSEIKAHDGMAAAVDKFWSEDDSYGKAAVLRGKSKPKRIDGRKEFVEGAQKRLLGNVTSNITDLADMHPETMFYYFIPPYSIARWDELDATGSVECQIEEEQMLIELVLEHENIKLFSYSDDFELVTNLDNYRDVTHYGPWINSELLVRMKNGEGLLTKDNYKDYINTIYEFYTTYDYDSLYED